MKFILITFLFLSAFVEAHETLEYALAERGIEVENFEPIGTEVHLSGEELTEKVNNMLTKNLLISYIEAGKGSEEGENIMERVLPLFGQGAEPWIAHPTEPGERHDHSIFDNSSYHLNQYGIMRDNDDEGLYRGLSDEDLHVIIHDYHIQLARSIAVDNCNNQALNRYRLSIPRFTGPPNLLDALYGNVTNPSYVIDEGMQYHCFSPSVQNPQNPQTP